MKFQGIYTPVITPYASDGSVDYLKETEASHVYVDDGSDLSGFIREVTDGVGVHGVFDPIGGDFPSR
ncbi:MAG: hypothetical protein AAFY03_13280, partial [Pseudomonadota bacterium]